MCILQRAMVMLALGAALSVTIVPVHAGDNNVAISVIDARIAQVRMEISRLALSASSDSVSSSEQADIKRKIHVLELRFANLHVARPFMVNLPLEQQQAYVVFEKEREPSRTKPQFNNGFGNGDQDAPGGSEFNNNAENAFGSN